MKSKSNKITVLSVSWYSSGLLFDLISNLLALAETPSGVEFLIIDNSNGIDQDLNNLKELRASIRILSNNPKKSKNLSAHALGLNFGFDHIDSEFLLIVDPDIYLFKKNWDKFFINELTNKNIDLIGTKYPSWWLGTYHNFPSPIFCFSKYSTMQNLKPNWLPNKANLLMRCRNFFFRQIIRGCLLFNKKALFKYRFLRTCTTMLEAFFPICSLDTGSNLAKRGIARKMKVKVFDSLYSDSEIINSHKNNVDFKELSEQYELYAYNGEFILTHQYGSQNLLLSTDKGTDREHWKILYNNVMKASY